MRQILAKFLLSVFFFLLFVGFSYLVQKKVFTSFDFDTTVKLQDHISRNYDTLLSSLSLLGSVEFVGIFLIIFLVVKRNLGLFFLIPSSFAVFHVLELFGKIFVRHPSPPFLFLRYNINFLFPSSYVQPGYSYPSGHAGRTVFVSVILLYFILSSKKINNDLKLLFAVLIVAFNIAMLISRVYLGEHWTSDVIGGGILGTALALFTVSFIKDRSLRSSSVSGF